MFGSCRSVKFGVAVLMVTATLAGASAPTYAATGSVRIIISRTAFVVGGGSGTLHFQGRSYPLRVGRSWQLSILFPTFGCATLFLRRRLCRTRLDIF